MHSSRAVLVRSHPQHCDLLHCCMDCVNFVWFGPPALCCTAGLTLLRLSCHIGRSYYVKRPERNNELGREGLGRPGGIVGQAAGLPAQRQRTRGENKQRLWDRAMTTVPVDRMTDCGPARAEDAVKHCAGDGRATRHGRAQPLARHRLHLQSRRASHRAGHLASQIGALDTICEGAVNGLLL